MSDPSHTTEELSQSAPQDQAVRKEVLHTSQSFAVSAPAGSGKTGLLTQRVLALLGTCEQPENVLAITFTKKAAAEMKHRILSALQATQQKLAANEPPPEDDYAKTTWKLACTVLKRDQEKNWQLLSLPNRLNITTIDSFCRQLSQQTPLTNELGNTPDVLDSAEANYAYQLAARDTLASIESDESIRPDLIRLIKHFNNQLNTLEELFIRLLQRRDQWLGLLYVTKDQRDFLESTLQNVITEHLEKTAEEILPYAGEILELADFAASHCSQANIESPIKNCAGIVELPLSDVNGIEQWLGLSELLTTKSGELRKTVTKNVGFPTADKTRSDEDNTFNKQQKKRITDLLKELKSEEKLIELLNGIRTLPLPTYEGSQWELLDSLTRVLLVLVAKLDIIFIGLGKTDFINITLAALRALGDEEQPTNLALILDYRIQHILVDEFQDTSSPQLELLKKLTAGWQPNDGRTLFLVGDAMQSCYSFRDANVGIFLNVREHGLGDIALKPVNLTVNFRSDSAIVNWCNQVFSTVLPKQSEVNTGAVKYQQAIAFNNANDDKLNTISSYLFVSDEKVASRTDEANKIAQIVNDAQEKDPTQSIAILVRKRSQVKLISQALQEQNIVYRATDINRLNTDMSIIDLRSLTRALLFPNDRLAWFSMLRAPWCGMDMNDLYYVGQYNIQYKHASLLTTLTQLVTSEKTSLTKTYEDQSATLTLSDDGFIILKRFLKTISSAITKCGRNNLREWVEGAWLQLGGGALLTKLDDYSKITTYFDLLEKYQQGYTLPQWETFDAAIDNLFEKNIIDNKADKPPVEIMTIHKSKGLEFDTVIIPGLDQSSASDKQDLIAWQEWLDENQQSRLLISPVHPVGSEKDKRDSIHDYIRIQQRQKQSLESNRLFYVACTRAIHNLYLLAHATLPKNKKAEKQQSEIATITFKPSTLLGKLWPTIEESTNIITIETDSKEATSNSALTHPAIISRLTSDWSLPEYPTTDLLKNYRLQHHAESLNADNRAKPDALLQRYSRYFGTVLHRALQDISESGYKQWDTTRVNQQRYFWQIQLEEIGTPEALAVEHSNQIINIINRILTSTTGQWILNNSHKDSACELSLWKEAHNKEMREYIIDRTFIDINTNTRWVIDYKSSTPSDGQSIEDFITQQELQYKNQLITYKQLFESKDETVKCALYFPILDKLHTLSIDK